MKLSAFFISFLLLLQFAGLGQHADSTTLNQPAPAEAGNSDAFPDFPWVKFLNKHIDYSIATFNHAPRGVHKVIIGFNVLADGSLANFEALTKRGYGMEREVMKALKKSPKWKPAMQNGKPVEVYRTQEVKFEVDYYIIWE